MTDIITKIKQRAAAAYPGDFSMQSYEINQQLDALKKLSNYREQFGDDNEIANVCITKAMTDWVDDFSMQLHEFESQINAANDFFPYENPSVPRDVLEGIKVRAFQQWSGDYTMMLYELNEQVNAWLQING